MLWLDLTYLASCQSRSLKGGRGHRSASFRGPGGGGANRGARPSGARAAGGRTGVRVLPGRGRRSASLRDARGRGREATMRYTASRPGGVPGTAAGTPEPCPTTARERVPPGAQVRRSASLRGAGTGARPSGAWAPERVPPGRGRSGTGGHRAVYHVPTGRCTRHGSGYAGAVPYGWHGSASLRGAGGQAEASSGDR